MTTLHPSKDVADDSNQKALEELARAIEWNWGQFALILARCNSASLRSHLMQRLREICSVEIREIVLDKSVKTLYSTIQAEFAEVQPSALMVCGLESVSTLDRLLTGANQVREEFRKNFHFPLVWWVTDEVLQKLIRLAPDLQSWFTTVEFEIATEELTHCIQETADQVFAKVLDAGAGIFLDNAALNLGTGSTSCNELESARHELESRGVRLDSELEASLEFVLGRAADGSMEQSRHHLERSLALWQQQSAPLAPQFWGEQNPTPTSSVLPPKIGGDGGGKIQNPNSLERIGCVLHSLGLWWRTYAERHRAEYEQACSRAKEYFQQCVEVFEQAHRPDLVAKFINALGEILQRLQQWDELEAVAQKALTLYSTFPDPFRLPRTHGFLAEVHLAKSAWTDAKQSAETALSILASAQSPGSNAVSSEQSANLDWVRSYHQGWYLFSLAKAHSSLGQAQEAIATLETAAADTKPYYDPELYIRILEELRSLYFKQGDYLKAFHIKQDQRSIEQQYGFRAFVGAGRLQPKQQVANPALPGIATQGTVAQEIAASGRQQDVNRLVERIGRSDHKLTVIQGQSGVGKSSLVQAGLIPALKQNAIGTHDVVPVLQQVYTDWVRELGKRLAEAVVETQILPLESETFDSLPAILDQLRKNAEQNLLTILIFDQFEEFFFVCKEPIQRRPFYEFMRDALDVPYAKVILSLREDYLYFLLECNNRIITLDIINNNILDKTILYYLGNFSVEDAKSVIQNLTEITQFPLEPPLIEALVQDLAGELGEVRPIELQVVGAQLQTEKITKLEQYREHGPKEKLVERFLEEVVKDCGSENEQIAKLVLYLLTDENNTRPLKNRADLELELEVKTETLDLVLEILVKSGLVLRVPASPADCYQLVHDYLVTFIRQQQSTKLIEELEKEREQRKRSETELNRVLKQQLKAAYAAGFGLVTLAFLAVAFGLQARISEKNARLREVNSTSESLFASQKGLEALIESLKAGKTIKQSFAFEINPDTRMRTIATLQQAVYGVTERNRLEGHTDEITSVSFSADGKLLASGSGSKDRSVKLWSLDGTLRRTLKGHSDGVTSVSFSPDSRIIASASKDRSVKLWSLDGTLRQTLKGHSDSVTSVSFSPDGKFLASGSKDKTVKLWRLDGTLLKTLEGHTDSIMDVSFSPDSKLLVSAGNDDRMKLWNQDGKLLRTIPSRGVTNVRFSSDGKTIVSVKRDSFNDVTDVNIWELDGSLLKTINIGQDDITNVTFSADDKMLASVDNSNRIVNLQKRINGDWIQSSSSLKGHSSNITSLSFSPDSKMLASASRDKTVRLWNLNSKLFITDKEENYRSISLAFSPDNQTIAIASEDRKVNLWQHGRKLLKSLSGYSFAVSFSPDGKLIASAGWDDAIRLWQRDSADIKTLHGHDADINQIDFSPDGKLMASASQDNTVKLWRRDGTFFKTLHGHRDKVNQVSFSPDSKIIASIDRSNSVKLWRSNGTLITTLSGHTGRVDTIRFSHNNKMIATIGDDNIVKLWRTDGTFIKTLKGHRKEVYDISFSSDNRTIAAVYEDSIVQIWRTDSDSFKPIKTCNELGENVIFSSDGKTIASIKSGTANISSDTVNLWSFTCTRLNRHQEGSDSISSISFSPDSQTIAVISRGKTIKLWRLDTQKIILLSQESNSNVSSVSFSHDGKTIAAIISPTDMRETDVRDQTVKLWKTDGTPIKSMGERSKPINFISLSPNGQVMAAASYDDAVKLWRSDGTFFKSLKGHTDWIKAVSFSPNGKLLASASADKTIRLWHGDGHADRPIKVFHGHNEAVNSISFSSDGKMLASASQDNTIKLWQTDGRSYPIKTLENRHTAGVNDLTFSPDGKIVASASDDNMVVLSYLNEGTFKGLKGHSNRVTSVRFSSDGKFIVSASNNEVNLWSRNGTLLKTYAWYTFGNYKATFSSDRKFIAALRNDGGAAIWSLNLDELLKRGCEQVWDYLKTNPNVELNDRHLCDGIAAQN